MKTLFNLRIVLGLFTIATFSLYSCSNEETQKKLNPNNSINQTDTSSGEKEESSDTVKVLSQKEKRDSLSKKITPHLETDTTKLLTDSTSPRYIYLTFDDGPLNGSQFIDSIATAKNIKINAFVIGKHDKMSKKLHKYYERYMANPLVDCYNHSFYHANNQFTTFYSNPQTAFEDFDSNEKALNLKYKIVRLPGRNIWYFADRKRIDMKSGSSTADLLYQNGYSSMGWDCEWSKGKPNGMPVESVNYVYKQIKNRLRNGTSFSKNNVVLLMHDDMFQTKKAQKMLTDLIDSLQTHPNFHFAHMRDYPMSK